MSDEPDLLGDGTGFASEEEWIGRLQGEVIGLRAERDRLRKAVEALTVERDEFRDLCGKHDPIGEDHMHEMMEHAARADEAEAEVRRLRAVAHYLRAAAHLFPHVNTDRATCERLTKDDDGDVWCLGCTVAATLDEACNLDVELMAGDAQEEWDERARQWMKNYEDASGEGA